LHVLVRLRVDVHCVTFGADAKNETSCPRGYKTCDSYARCRVNVWSSLRNCGDCGVKCPWRVPHAFSECRKGQCKLDCKKSWGNCDGNATNGCETSLLTTPAHCGKCATACTAPQNATATCLQGKCQVQCDPGLTKCRSNCTDLQSDKYNCGRCNHVCPDQAATNVSWAYTGICVQACFPGNITPIQISTFDSILDLFNPNGIMWGDVLQATLQ
jgi:hypothetical protein